MEKEALDKESLAVLNERRDGLSPRIHLIGDRQATPSTEKFLTVNELAKETGYSKSHLRNLLRVGKLRGQKTIDTWLTTHTALNNYKHALNSNQ